MQLTDTQLRRRRFLAVLVAALAALVAALALPGGASAAADEALSKSAGGGLDILQVDTSEWPNVRVAFSLEESSAKVPNVRIEENGRKVGDPDVYLGKLGTYEEQPENVLFLVLDASKTMEGAKFEQAKAAARDLIAQSQGDDRIGLVTFGADAELVVEPTSDHDELVAALDEVKITQGTRMHDALAIAGESFPEDATRRMVVLLADGQDIESKNTLDEALEIAKEARAEVHAVGIEGKVFFPGTLERIANTTGGSFERVARAEDLQGVYAELGRRLLRGYWLEYRSTQEPGKAVEFSMSVEEFEAPAFFRAPAVRGSDGKALKISEPEAATPPKPLIDLPGGRLGVLLAALPFGLMIGWLVLAKLHAAGNPNLLKRIEPYTKRRTVVQVKEKRSRGAALAPLMTAAEAVLGRTSLFRHYRFMLEQANLPLRAAELLSMNVAGMLLGLVVGFLILGGFVFGIIFTLLFAAMPYFWVRLKARKRKKMFEDQLADVLSTVSSSLKAGHSFNQSIQAVVKETPNPTSEEFQRVMTEARLGMPLEAALENMATRLGSNDFDFVVTTVNIQRTVGGSLAEILEMVGDTVRGRQQFRKKVKALTSMGVASAYVLLAMPFFMAGVLTLMNRDYMRPLFYTPTGHKMLIAGGFFMTIGYFACMKVVKVKV